MIWGGEWFGGKKVIWKYKVMERGPKKSLKVFQSKYCFPKIKTMFYLDIDRFMGHWVLHWASLGEGIMVLCDKSPEDGSGLVSLSRSCGQCYGSFIPDWNLFVISDWATPSFTASSGHSMGLAPYHDSQTNPEGSREQTHAHLCVISSAHDRLLISLPLENKPSVPLSSLNLFQVS